MSYLRRSTTPVTTVAIAAFGGLLLAGCGGGSSTSSAPEVTASVKPSSAAASAAQAVTRGEMCGQTRGPDGALFVHALGTTKVDCAEAMRVADAFGPKIASAQPATVEGWHCTLPDSPGLLARCDNGQKAIGFFSSH